MVIYYSNQGDLVYWKEGKYAPLLNKVQLHEDVFCGGEIILSIITLDTKWMYE